MMWQKADVAYFTVLCWHSPGVTEQKSRIRSIRAAGSKSRFERSTSGIQVRRPTTCSIPFVRLILSLLHSDVFIFHAHTLVTYFILIIDIVRLVVLLHIGSRPTAGPRRPSLKFRPEISYPVWGGCYRGIYLKYATTASFRIFILLFSISLLFDAVWPIQRKKASLNKPRSISKIHSSLWSVCRTAGSISS
jgi:hypothetical protein